MRVVFPADYFKSSQPDEMFVDQARAFAGAGFSVSAWSEENQTFKPALAAGETVLYRGWMLNDGAYAKLAAKAEQAGAQMFTTPAQYLAAHHLPNWYPLVKDLTPETVCFSDLSNLRAELEKLGWSGFFVKDYVKSLKTSLGSRLEQAHGIDVLMADMQKFRGQIEGGICVRRIEEFNQETERRYFVLKGIPYSPDGSDVPELVRQVAERVRLPFYSVDIIQRQDGVWRVVELGDGQVSDLVGWDAERFVQMWVSASE